MARRIPTARNLKPGRQRTYPKVAYPRAKKPKVFPANTNLAPRLHPRLPRLPKTRGARAWDLVYSFRQGELGPEKEWITHPSNPAFWISPGIAEPHNNHEKVIAGYDTYNVIAPKTGYNIDMDFFQDFTLLKPSTGQGTWSFTAHVPAYEDPFFFPIIVPQIWPVSRPLYEPYNDPGGYEPRRQQRFQRARPFPRFGFQRHANGHVSVLPNPSSSKPKRMRETKYQMTAPYYFAVKSIVNGAGEAVEWIGILARASGSPYDHPKWQFHWLFAEGGIMNLDLDILIEEIVKNEIEDRFYGALGGLSKKAARELGLSFGPQTGLAM